MNLERQASQTLDPCTGIARDSWTGCFQAWAFSLRGAMKTRYGTGLREPHDMGAGSIMTTTGNVSLLRNPDQESWLGEE